MIRRLCAAYVAGAVAALLSSIALWAVGRAGLPHAVGVDLTPMLSWDWLGPRMLAGSLYALLYPLLRRAGLGTLRAALSVSLLASAVELLWLMPQAGAGLMGASLGSLAFAVVLAANALWGILLPQVIRAMRGLGPVLT